MAKKIPVSDVLTSLKAVADAVTANTVELTASRGLEGRVTSQEQATAVLDYMVLREVLGRQATELSMIVMATRGARKPANIQINDVPIEATHVALFTRDGGPPDEVIPLPPAPSGTSAPSTRKVKTNILRTTRILRIELRQADGHPIRLGSQILPS